MIGLECCRDESSVQRRSNYVTCCYWFASVADIGFLSLHKSDRIRDSNARRNHLRLKSLNAYYKLPNSRRRSRIAGRRRASAHSIADPSNQHLSADGNIHSPCRLFRGRWWRQNSQSSGLHDQADISAITPPAFIKRKSRPARIGIAGTDGCMSRKIAEDHELSIPMLSPTRPKRIARAERHGLNSLPESEDGFLRRHP